MKIIGLTGGIASGKSAVAAELGRLGAEVLDADEAVHRALLQPEVKQALVDRWGEEILTASGNIDRGAVAKRVFSADPHSGSGQELAFLESQLHPRIRTEFEQRIRDLEDTHTPAVVIDAPLLLEAGWDGMCDSVIFVDTPREIRQDRARARNWQPEDFAVREAAQMPIDEKRRRATHVIRNEGSLEELRAAVRHFWDLPS